ncbi:hypothetical protein SERLA73DRAFT_171808 [Serpula lacrymans var. lacrymans S7.3]|uniref:Rho-GAP domain-containing protein n=2 Tax=Serpula lacrymans var. lacrymans TaxID=341189 RepID=F8QCT8_SERL3|nr:CDC42 Rho GTPase activating protein [Serpula lacrymans var. lacrymans S7.9]EGN93953.1 hypothetical protein SERLA73DRAFT_171808 [Serpula lacrymans var. lacrymans S7.3]EGO19319.1 CDC42 Rho GTPase activating protein [Serpula lacrymans var. lacrymans S7.9]
MAPNLKQRLAALSLAPSSPTSPFGSPLNSPGGRRKAIFNPPWMRRNSHDAANDEPVTHERMQDVMSKVIFQAGVDFETRPMVVLNASALPDPREVSYDLLLSRILSYLDLYVESDYTVVFFAAGGRHAPGWNWVWKAYRSLSRKYRKNLKRLYIVHSSFFSKMLFSLAGAIISPKFFRKIIYINTLSELACHVPLTQIDISPPVYQENLKHERQINLPTPSRASIFGVPLEDLMGFDGEKGSVPRVVKDCIQFLRDTGMQEEGLFRRSPSSALLKQVQDAYDRGQVVSLQTFNDPHLAAVLLKKYLRDLPEPLFPEKLYPEIRRCPCPTDDPGDLASVAYVRESLLPLLSPCVYILLSHILHLMHDVSLRVSVNRMDAHNLAVVLCPNLVASPNPAKDVLMCTVPGAPTLYQTQSSSSSTLTGSSSSASNSVEGKNTLGAVIKLCIKRYYEIFDEVQDRAEAVRPTVSASASPSPSPSPSPPASSASSVSWTKQNQRISLNGDDEDIDDAMLVMPIGPSGNGAASMASNGRSSSTPRAWASSTTSVGETGSAVPYKPRQRKSPANGSRSVYTYTDGGAGGNVFGTRAKTRSVISIERAAIGNGRGSISVGRGTMRKSGGSGVEAVGVTASGFFTPPGSAPPVPSLTGRSG